MFRPETSIQGQELPVDSIEHQGHHEAVLPRPITYTDPASERTVDSSQMAGSLLDTSSQGEKTANTLLEQSEASITNERETISGFGEDTPIPRNCDDATVKDVAIPPKLTLRTANLVPLSEITYDVKVITFRDQKRPIVCQNANGPCPIISLANILSLSSSLPIKMDTTSISAMHLTALLAEHLLTNNGDLGVVGEIEGLHRGLNVDPSFTGVTDFAYGPSAISGFGCEMLHGWIPSEEDGLDIFNLLTTKYTSYDTVQTQLLSNTDDGESLTIKQFLKKYPNNLTPYGLTLLDFNIQPGGLRMLFYNSHFSLLYKHPISEQLYTLATDSGYIDSGDDVVWENLVLGSTQFFSGDFVPQSIIGESRRAQRDREHVPGPVSPFPGSSQSIDLDAQLAASLAQATLR